MKKTNGFLAAITAMLATNFIRDYVIVPLTLNETIESPNVVIWLILIAAVIIGFIMLFSNKTKRTFIPMGKTIELEGIIYNCDKRKENETCLDCELPVIKCSYQCDANEREDKQNIIFRKIN